MNVWCCLSKNKMIHLKLVRFSHRSYRLPDIWWSKQNTKQTNNNQKTEYQIHEKKTPTNDHDDDEMYLSKGKHRWERPRGH